MPTTSRRAFLTSLIALGVAAGLPLPIGLDRPEAKRIIYGYDRAEGLSTTVAARHNPDGTLDVLWQRQAYEPPKTGRYVNDFLIG